MDDLEIVNKSNSNKKKKNPYPQHFVHILQPSN